MRMLSPLQVTCGGCHFVGWSWERLTKRKYISVYQETILIIWIKCYYYGYVGYLPIYNHYSFLFWHEHHKKKSIIPLFYRPWLIVCIQEPVAYIGQTYLQKVKGLIITIASFCLNSEFLKRFRKSFSIHDQMLLNTYLAIMIPYIKPEYLFW